MIRINLLRFHTIRRELKVNNIFLTIDSSNSETKGLLVVCESKHAKKWKSLVSEDESCPIGLFDDLLEVKAFALGLRIGQNKPWKD